MNKFKIGDREYQTKQISVLPYWISNCGEVISTVREIPKILRGGLSGNYRSLILTRGGNRDIVRHHHLVMHWWVGPRPIGMVINHKNGNKLDNRLENLEYCTPKENRYVALIKKAYDIGMSYNQLARAFKVNKAAILRIINGENWKYHENDSVQMVRTIGSTIWTKVQEGWKDNITGLIWYPKETRIFTHHEAMNLETETKRLPTKEEFEEAEKHGIRELLEITFGLYWSASIHPIYSTNAYGLDGNRGGISYYFRAFANGSVLMVGR